MASLSEELSGDVAHTKCDLNDLAMDAELRRLVGTFVNLVDSQKNVTK